jgi:uncharacterized UPF0146 family protein
VKPNGRVIVEIGAGQADAVSRILAGHGLEILAVRADLAGIPRSVAAVRV